MQALRRSGFLRSPALESQNERGARVAEIEDASSLLYRLSGGIVLGPDSFCDGASMKCRAGS